jgi:hypothetical protein
MPRPGCVWTHTLLIDFADLAVLASPSHLESLFKRPSKELGIYSLALEIDDDRLAHEQPTIEGTWDEDQVYSTVNGLYGQHKDRVVSRRDLSGATESLALRIWNQQWPRLRRSFRFCTLTTKDRSVDGSPFDLPFALRSDLGGRGRISGTAEASDYPTNESRVWLQELATDLYAEGSTELRTYLREAGSDVLAGREAMQPFCELHLNLQEPAGEEDLDRSIACLHSSPLFHGSRFAKLRVAQFVLRHVQYASVDALSFLVENIEEIERADLDQHAGQFVERLWESQPAVFLKLARESSREGFFADALLLLPAAAIFDQLPRVQYLLPALLEMRSDLLHEARFWDLAQLSPDLVRQSALVLDYAKILPAMLEGLHNEEAISSAVSLCGPLLVLNTLQAALVGPAKVAAPALWARHACRDSGATATFLSTVSKPSEFLLEAISDEVVPEEVPNEVGHDPWLHAFQELRSQNRMSAKLAAYGFRRALGWRSRSIAELLCVTFDPLYTAVAASSIDEIEWNRLADRLPWVSESERWDKCGRLRSTVAKLFLDRHLWPRTFAFVTAQDDVFVMIAKAVNDMWGGRRFLREVEDALDSSQELEQRRKNQLRDYRRATRGRFF